MTSAAFSVIRGLLREIESAIPARRPHIRDQYRSMKYGMRRRGLVNDKGRCHSAVQKPAGATCDVERCISPEIIQMSAGAFRRITPVKRWSRNGSLFKLASQLRSIANTVTSKTTNMDSSRQLPIQQHECGHPAGGPYPGWTCPGGEDASGQQTPCLSCTSTSVTRVEYVSLYSPFAAQPYWTGIETPLCVVRPPTVAVTAAFRSQAPPAP